MAHYSLDVYKRLHFLAREFPDASSPELASELQEHVKRITAPYKYPREIEFMESLPKTISGKIRRVELREMEHQKKLGK